MSEQESAPSLLEFETQQKVRAALAQDQALEAVRRATPVAPAAPVDTEAEQRRFWALAQLRETGVARQIGGEPRLVAWVNPDGSTNIRSDPDRPGKTIATVVHTPTPLIVTECKIWTDEEEAALLRQQREAENTLLASRFDVAEMVAAGILTEAEATHPGVQAAAAARAKRQAESGIPYSLENSVR